MPAADANAARRLALLIDADNVPAKLLPLLLQEAEGLGTLVIRRAYGNSNTWSKTAVRTFVQKNAISPVLVIPATSGKDAADMKLVIEAVDFLHREKLDGMCIASSDGDFAPLAVHLRENGLWVCGFGEAKTPEPYRAAFDRFVVLGRETAARTERATGRRAPPASKRLPAPSRSAATQAKPAATPGQSKPAKLPVPNAEIVAKVVELGREDGWANLGTVGQHLNKRPEKFDPRKYGYKSLRNLMTAVDGLEMGETKSPGGNSVVRVRKRPGAAPSSR